MFGSSQSLGLPSTRPTFGLWGVFKLLLFIAVLAAAGWLLVQYLVHSQLRDLAQQKVDQVMADSGLQVSIGQAEFYEHRGFRLGNVTIDLAKTATDQANDRPASSLQVYELFVHADTTLAGLATEPLHPTAIEIKRARLKLVRGVNGDWDFQQIIPRLLKLKPESERRIPIQFSDCELVLFDQARPEKPVTLEHVDFSFHEISHNGRPMLQLDGQLQTRAISQVTLTAYLDIQQQRWHARFDATQASLSREMASFIPELKSELTSLKSLAGTIDFEATAEGSLSLDQLPSFHVRGEINDFSLDDDRLPCSIQQVSAEFELGDRGLAVRNAQGRFNRDGTFLINYWQSGLLERTQWHADGRVNGFYFAQQPRLMRWLPEYCLKFCEDFDPKGSSNVSFDLTHDGQRLNRTITGQMTDLSFSFIRMPYRVDHCIGTVDWQGERCDFDVRSQLGDQPVRMFGFADNIGQGATYQIDLDVPGTLPVDQKMLEAVDAQPKLAHVIRAFRPSGRVGGKGRIEKRESDGDVFKDFDLRLEGCDVRHESFDYPIYNISGHVKVKDDEYTFHDLRGNNSSGRVSCNGSWNPQEGLGLRFLCQAVPLNDQLRFALKPDMREIWNGFRPRGKLDFLKVDMTLPPGKELDLEMEAILRQSDDDAEANYVSIYPTWFPYQINHLTGKIQIGKGRITLTGMQGQHQKTWVTCNGQGHYSDQSWSLRMTDLLVSSLKVDEDLLAAVPRSLAPPLAQLRFDGLLNVNGVITLAGQKLTSQTILPSGPGRAENGQFDSSQRRETSGLNRSGTSMAWDLRLDMNQAEMLIGLPLKNVFGTLHLRGIFDGQQVDCNGRLDVDSLTIYDTQITQVRGPIQITNDRVIAGALIEQYASESPLNALLIDNNTIGKSITGVLHEGMLQLDARLDSENQNEFYVQATLADSCLGTACRELAPSLENVEGHSYGSIRLSGNGSGTHSHRGQGSIQLRDAKIYELPVFLSLLKILNVRQPSRTAFDSGNIDFTIVGETINFDRMEFNGDAISLIGNGEMNLDRDIDLNFYSVMGRNRINIPLISDWYRKGSQRIMWINVDGKLDNPQTHRNMLSGMNDSLRQLFLPRPLGVAQLRKDRMVRQAGAMLPVGESYFDSTDDGPFQLQVQRPNWAY